MIASAVRRLVREPRGSIVDCVGCGLMVWRKETKWGGNNRKRCRACVTADALMWGAHEGWPAPEPDDKSASATHSIQELTPSGGIVNSMYSRNHRGLQPVMHRSGGAGRHMALCGVQGGLQIHIKSGVTCVKCLAILKEEQHGQTTNGRATRQASSNQR